MLKPLRFNNLLKALPGLSHLQHTQHSATHKYTEQLSKLSDEHVPASEHVKKTLDVDVDKRQITHTSQGASEKDTHTHAHVTEEVSIPSGKAVAAPHAHAVTTTTEATVKKEVSISQVKTEADGTTITLSHVHATTVGVASIEMTPPHPPREETPAYAKTHHHLVITLDSPCAICGVRNSTLGDPKQNLFSAQDLETHHYPIERCLLDACDPKKIAVVFPQVKDRATLEDFIDSEANMMVLCDVHHRHPFFGIHHLVGPDFYVQPFLYGGYQIVSDLAHETATMALDEKIVHKHVSVEEINHGDHTQEKKITKESTTVTTHTTQTKG